MTSYDQVSAQDALAGFASVISTYEHRIGHVCRAVASHLPLLIKSLPSAGGTVLDNACGTGAVTEELLKVYPEAHVWAADVTPTMVESFNAAAAANPTAARQLKGVRLEDGQKLSFVDNSFDASVTNFGIFFFSDPVAGAKEIYRTLKFSGTAIVTVWKTLGFKPILWEVQNRVNPQDPLTELPLIEPWCNSRLIETTLREGGFTDIDLRSVRTSMWGSNLEDFKLVCQENFKSMVSGKWTDQEMKMIKPVTEQVLDELQDQLCIKDGEKVGCVMEAWIAICTK